VRCCEGKKAGFLLSFSAEFLILKTSLFSFPDTPVHKKRGLPAKRE